MQVSRDLPGAPPFRPTRADGQAPAHVERHTDDYDYTFVGNPEDVVVSTRPGAALIGGGDDPDPAFRWMVDHSGGGDFVVLRASGEDGYNPYVRDLGGANSVATIVTRSRNASYDDFVLGQVRNAEAIFIAGGDQADYVRQWQGTPLQDAINDAVARGVPVGGTSAGLAVLADHPFTALKDTVTSPEALADPRGEKVILGGDFLSIPHMRYTVTDTHFHERDRMGRFMAFVADAAQDNGTARGIAVDERTAVLVEGDGNARVVGPGAAYFLQAPGAPEQCLPGYPLRFYNVPVTCVKEGGSFDLASWTGQGGVSYNLSAHDGVLTSTQASGSPY